MKMKVVYYVGTSREFPYGQTGYYDKEHALFYPDGYEGCFRVNPENVILTSISKKEKSDFRV